MHRQMGLTPVSSFSGNFSTSTVSRCYQKISQPQTGRDCSVQKCASAANFSSSRPSTENLKIVKSSWWTSGEKATSWSSGACGCPAIGCLRSTTRRFSSTLTRPLTTRRTVASSSLCWKWGRTAFESRDSYQGGTASSILWNTLNRHTYLMWKLVTQRP